MNSVLVILMLALTSHTQITRDDILINMFLVIFATGFGTPLINLVFDSDYVKHLLKKYYAKKLVEKQEITQKNLNYMLELPEINLPDKYANVFILALVAFFFGPPAPWASMLATLGLVFTIIVERYIITRRLSISKDLSGQLSFAMT